MAIPTISSVQPVAGPSSGGDLVRLVGVGFADRVRVVFGGALAVVVSVRDEAGQRIADVRTPIHEVGIVDVELTNLDAAGVPVAGEEESKVRGIPSAPTSVAGAIGIAERGPIGVAVLCSSFDEFETKFGGFTPDSDLALAAMDFFENGGALLWVVRTAHYADVANPASATAVRAAGFLVAGGGPTPAVLLGTAPEPFVLSDGDLIRLAVDGAAEIDAVFNGSAAAMAASGAGPYALADGMALLLRVDNGVEQTVRFSADDFADIANATATEVAAAINAAIVGGRATTSGGIVRLASDTEGTASRVQVTGGSANAVLAFPGAAAVGGGNVANLRAVEVAEVKAVVEAAIPTVTVNPGVGGVLEIRTVATDTAASVQAKP